MGHLLSPDFFDASRYPQLRISASSELSVADDGSVVLRGEVDLRGEKREVEANGKFGQLGANLAGNARVGLSPSLPRSTASQLLCSLECRAAQRRRGNSTTRSRSQSSWSWLRRPSNDAGARHLRQPAERAR